ncbi:hypothetical protein C2G38_2220873 [Gigaspora rosea]|uniref:Uncharacterized protein n=1 Tax=Gigaspora rosea TaxID=44941 RepID=A0A397U8B6_9GLOM|nr:hypothetical protein C2G38_2220873 [Gigaspora rosea]
MGKILPMGIPIGTAEPMEEFGRPMVTEKKIIISNLESQIIVNDDNTVSIPFEPARIKKSTNRIDNVIKHTTKGHEYVNEIQTEIKKDKLYWSWIMFCSGNRNNCQHKYGGIASFNGASEEELNNALLNSHEICSNTELNCFITHEDRRLKDNASSWTMLHYLVEEELMSKGYILYYQQPDLTKPEDSSEHYYQLTVLDEFWL